MADATLFDSTETAPGVERHEMPNGMVIYYRDSDHAYWAGHNPKTGVCSGRIPGISTVSKNDGDTNIDGLVDWGSRLSCEGVARLVSEGGVFEWATSGDAIWKTLQDRKLTWRHVRDEKGKVGSVSHGVLQSLAEGRTALLKTGYDHAVADWWAKRGPKTELVEQVVYSSEYGFAGRFDLLARIGPDRVLCDLKTSGYISNSFHIQLAGYSQGLLDSGWTPPDRMMVLQVRDDGSWTEWACHATPDDFLAALKIYQRGKAITSKARKSWKAWKDSQ